MHRIILGILFSLWASCALAQGCGPANPNCIVPTAPAGTSDNRAASTAFVQGAVGPTNLAPPFTTYCNPTGITAIPQWCAAITAVAPLGITGTTINANTDDGTLHNLFLGGSGNALLTGTQNIAMGNLALLGVTSGGGNFALGAGALVANTQGANNVAIGVNSLSSNTTASSNVAVGAATLSANIVGTLNTAVGVNAANKATNSAVTAIGELALFDLISGGGNTAVGPQSGRGITTGTNSSIFGGCTGLASGLSNAIVLCDGANNVRIDWGKTTASTLTLNGPVVSTTTSQTKLVYSAAGTPLPTCNGAAEGTWAAVSDATAPTYAANYTSGGAVHVPVYCNGTNWITP